MTRLDRPARPGHAQRNRGTAWGAGTMLVLGAALLLGGCSHDAKPIVTSDDEAVINTYPKNYKADILAGMHAFLNDPTGIRDAAIAEPVLKAVGTNTRYVACLKFNAKKNATQYAGVREVAAVFLLGRLDDLIDAPKKVCTGATYTPFPELQKLAP